ncbi:MAG: PKD domain-containing protein [Ginsengibacter sp.]
MSIAVHKKLLSKFFIIILVLLYSGNILAQPVADFSATPVVGCAPLLVQFTDLSTGNPTSLKWDLGNGTPSSSSTPSTTYFTPGQYKVTLIAKNASGSDTIVKDKFITVQVNPTVNFTATPTSGCLPLAVQFTDQSTAGAGTLTTWKWDYGDGSTSTDQSPQHMYTSSGIFDVTLQVKNSFGCTGTTSKTRLINTSNSVTADFSNNVQATCKPPVTLNFQNLSTGPASRKYQWDFGDGGTSNQTTPSHMYTTVGSFTVRLIASSGGGECSDTMQKVIIIGTVTPDFSSPLTVCSGVLFSLNNTSVPVPSGVSWNFGDGTKSDSINPVKAYSTAGNYTIKMVADFGACRDSVSKPITVLSKQNVAFTADDTTACKAPFNVTFNSNVPGATSYSWNFGDGSASPDPNPVHTYNALGNYDVTLITTNSSGCRDTLKKTAYIKIQAVTVALPYLPLKNCVPFTYTFTSAISTSEPVVSYNWNFGDGTTTDTAANPIHTFTTPGSYTITLTITTINGCTATVTKTNGVIVGNKPIVNFSASPLIACVNIPISFTDNSTGNVDEWLWDFGDKGTSANKNPIHSYLDTGYFKVKLIGRSSGCPDSISFSNYIYIKPPLSKFVVKSNCILPNQKSFIDSSRGADSWEWNFGDGSPVSTLRNPVHIYPDTGTYIATLKVTNFSTGCDHTSTFNVQVIMEKAMFTASATNLCKDVTIYFKSQNKSSKLSNFNWNFGDGFPAQNVRDSVFHRYAILGSFDVRLIITDIFGCKDTLVKPKYINVNGPVAKFSSLTGACINTAVNFIDSSISNGGFPIVQWIWNYGDNTTDVLTAPPFMHTYAQSGIFSIKLKVKDSNGCTDSLDKKNYLVISKPVAGFTAKDTATCPATPVQFTNTSQGPNLTYLWSFGDGDTSSTINPLHQYLSTGIFTVGLKITDQYGCTDSIQKVNHIAVTLPKADFTLTDSVSACPPFLVSFVNTSVNYTSIEWDFGDGNPPTTQVSPTHFYYIPGTYIVKLKVTGPGGCFDEKFVTIVVKGPKGVLSYTNIIGCNSLTTDFKASATDNILFTWDFNDGSTIQTTDSSISHTYTDIGFYIPKLILEDVNGCQVPILGIDTIKVISVQSNFNTLSTIICDAGDVFFKDSTISNDTVSNWLWDFGDGGTSIQMDPVHNYTTPGLYNVSQITTTANGCKDTAVKNGYIRIVARPDINIQTSAGRCELDTLIFKGIFLQPDTSIVTWQWDFGNGQTSAIQNPPSQTFSPSGNYVINAIATNSSGCRDTATQAITINPLPNVNAGNDIFLCLGSSAQLQASGAISYQWIPPVNFLSCTNCSNPITNTPDDITYIVRGSNNFGCIAFDSVNVRVKKPFTITITPPEDSVCIGQSVQLNASISDNYLWTPANSLSSAVIRNPVASPDTTVIYKVLAYDSANCFKDSAFVKISVFKYPLVNAGPDKTIKAGSSALLSPLYSNDITDWLWTPATGLTCNICPEPVAKPNVTTTYIIRVTNNGGCLATDDVTIFTTCTSGNIFVPNTFSPNGDGANDIFYPRGTGLNRIRGMKIFNRWGEVVFEKSNFYPNDPASGWNGLVGGRSVPPDVYTFVIDIICDNNDVIVQQGSITLIK